MSPSHWGPPIWIFFHTLAEKINADQFAAVFPTLFQFISRICRVLPCPECSKHATLFLSKVNPAGVRDKNDFKNILYIFHNVVNRRKNKPPFDIQQLSSTYQSKNIIECYNKFIAAYHTTGNMKLLAETFQRNMIKKEFRSWFLTNVQHFSG